MKLKLSILLGMICLTVFSLVVFNSKQANANPSGFYQSFIGTTPTNAGNVASTTLVFMTPGTATTTLYWDSGLFGASAQGSESAVILAQVTGSSTAANIQIFQEYSQGVPGNSSVNCVATPTACDWYQSSVTALNNYATTTADVGYNIGAVSKFNWSVSTSSPFGQVAPFTNVDTRAITVQTPARYSRFIFTLRGANAGLWASLVAKKQNP